MKKVLILAYDFPPYNSIGGQRPYAWYQYLPDFSVRPVVITRQWDVETHGNATAYTGSGYSATVDIKTDDDRKEIHYIPYKPNLRDRLARCNNPFPRLLGKCLSVLQMLSDPFCFAFDNKSGIYHYAKAFLKENTVDYILVSGEPFVLFRYAKKLSKRFDTPWVGDYRDGWSWNHSRKNKLLRWYLRFWEKQHTRSAYALTTVSNTFKKQLRTLFPDKAIHLIYNGYFEELFEGVAVSQTDHFRIAFSGTLYDYQPIELFFRALHQIPESVFPESFEIIFLGMEDQPAQKERILKLLNAWSSSCVRFTPKLPQKELIRELALARLCLLPANPEYPQIYAKVFEYIALNKPVLYFQPDDSDLDALLEDYPNLIPCLDVDSICNAMSRLLKEKQAIETNAFVSEYTRKKQCEKLSALFY